MMITLRGVSKSFRGRPAVIGLDLEVRRGELFGLLGHNGAGKSTTFGMLLGQVRPDAGEISVRGFSVAERRQDALARVGAIFETPAFYGYLSGWQNLRLLAACSGPIDPARLGRAVEMVGLSSRIHDPVRTYSHGMRQRLALAQALCPEPELLLLDEPTEGLDPEGIHEMRTLVTGLCRDSGVTILLSSHLLSEVEQMCDRVAILNRGRLVYCGEWATLQIGGRRLRLGLEGEAESVLSRLGVRSLGDEIFELPSGMDIADLVAELVGSGVRVRKVEPMKLTLEQTYLEVIRDA